MSADPALARIRESVRNQRFTEAVRSINDRYRDIGSPVLAVLSRMFSILVTPTFRGDLSSLGAALGICRPGERRHLEDFVSDQRSQNCLTAVLRSLEEQVPSGVRVGFRSARDYFSTSEFHATYRSDIVDYEPGLSRLTDKRLGRLLSHDPEGLDWTLFDEPPLAKKREVLEAYESESLRPINETFEETLVKVESFFGVLADHASRFSSFFDTFRGSGFIADDDTFAEWSVLGDEFFHIELSKSALMLPISPRALYWGMVGEYPRTLALLRELKSLVTPEFAFSGPDREGDAWRIGIVCENPGTLKGRGFTMEATLFFRTEALPKSLPCSLTVETVDPDRSYSLKAALPPELSAPLGLSVRITCESRYYRRPFSLDKRFELS